MSIEEVRALVAERQRYDDWLAALDAKRADTPPRVFERVRGDYVGRRAEVLTRLQSHVGALAAFGDDLGQRLTDLETRLAAHEEELAEGMLRNLVGEYDSERWEAVRQDVEAKIASLGHERSVLVTEVEDVRGLLASAMVAQGSEAQSPVAGEATGQAEMVVPAAAPEAEFGGEALAAPEPEPEAAAPREGTPASVPVIAEAPVPAVEAMSVPEGAMDGDISDGMAPAFAPPAANDVLLDIDVPEITGPAGSATASHEEVLEDVAALFDTESLVTIPEPSTPAPASGAHPELDDPLALFGETEGAADSQFVESLQGVHPEHESPAGGRAAPPTRAPVNDPFDDLAFLRSVTDPGEASGGAGAGAPAAAGDTLKTLRCTECGTMNLPTEWYCERCGGELAAF